MLPPDTLGNLLIVLAARTPASRYNAAFVFLHDDVGIYRIESGELSQSQLKASVQRLIPGGAAYRLVKIPVAWARSRVGAARRRHAERGTPEPLGLASAAESARPGSRGTTAASLRRRGSRALRRRRPRAREEVGGAPRTTRVPRLVSAKALRSTSSCSRPARRSPPSSRRRKRRVASSRSRSRGGRSLVLAAAARRADPPVKDAALRYSRTRRRGARARRGGDDQEHRAARADHQPPARAAVFARVLREGAEPAPHSRRRPASDPDAVSADRGHSRTELAERRYGTGARTVRARGHGPATDEPPAVQDR